MTTRLLVVAVALLAAVAVADGVRPAPRERSVPAAPEPVERAASAAYAPQGGLTRTRVIQEGRVVLTAEDVGRAFPGPEDGQPFDIAHVATAPDGALVVAVHKFPAKEGVASALEIWRDGALVSAFSVPPGSFAGGVGFAREGELVAIVGDDGYTARLFTRAGRYAGAVAVTSW